MTGQSLKPACAIQAHMQPLIGRKPDEVLTLTGVQTINAHCLMNGKAVKIRHCPATVIAESGAL